MSDFKAAWRMGAAAATMVIAAAGCATSPQQSADAGYSSPAAGGRYAPGDRFFQGGAVQASYPRGTTLAQGRARQRQVYAGIEGARRAHAVHDPQTAEDLDGDCEAQIRVAAYETIQDVSNLCDVPVSVLVRYNPDMRGVRSVIAGETLHIPHGQSYWIDQTELPANRAGASAAIDASFDGATKYKASRVNVPTFARDVYHVKPGDTLSEIARVHGVTPAVLATINQSVNWTMLAVGEPIVVPASEQIETSAGDDTWEEDAEWEEVSTEPTSPAEPAFTPPSAPARPSVPSAAVLGVSDNAVKGGRLVTVNGEKLPPNTSVTLLVGPNGSDLDPVGVFYTDADGDFSTEAKVPSASGAGGVIFAVAIGGNLIYSERVAVLKVD